MTANDKSHYAYYDYARKYVLELVICIVLLHVRIMHTIQP